MAVGQDPAGSGMIKAIMFLLGLAAAAVAGIIYLIARFGVPVPREAIRTVKANWGRTLVTLALFGGLIGALFAITGSAPPSYELQLSHQYDAEITGVSVKIGNEELVFYRVAPGTAIAAYDLSAQPAQADVYWNDPEGVSQAARAIVVGGARDDYKNGQLRITIVAPDKVLAVFVIPKQNAS